MRHPAMPVSMSTGGGSGVGDLPVLADKVFEEEGSRLADGKNHIIRGNKIEQTGQEVGTCLCLGLQRCLRCHGRKQADQTRRRGERYLVLHGGD